MNIAMIYVLAVILTIVLAGPVALLAPVLFAVTLDLPADDVGEILSPRTIETMTAEQAPSVSCAPFVRVYTQRGSRVAVTHPARRSQATVATSYACLPSDLKGAARKAATAKAGRKGCTSHACPTVRL